MKNKLHTLILGGSLALGLLAVVPAVRAEQAAAPAEKPPRERAAGNSEERLARVKEQLGLTAEQVATLKEIMAAEREEVRAKMTELGKDAAREDRMAARRAIQDKYLSKLEAVLTPEQFAKFKQLRERAPRPQGGPGGQGKGGPGGERPEAGHKGPPEA